MLHIVLLICAVSTPPAQCNRDTAYSVIPSGYAATNLACFMDGEARVASNQISDERVYSKVVCERTK